MGDRDITIVSTTDSAEDVQAALTGKPAESSEPAKPAETSTPAETSAVPVVEAKPAETPAAPVADAATSDEKPADSAQADDKPAAQETKDQRDARLETERKNSRERRLAKIQSEIDGYVAKKHETRREAEQAAAELEDLRRRRDQLHAEVEAAEGKRQPVAAPASAPASDIAAVVAKDPRVVAARQGLAMVGPEPQLDDTNADGTARFGSYEAYVSAVAKWNRTAATAEAKVAAAEEAALAKQELTQADRARIERDEATRAQHEILATYNDHLEEFKQRTPDFDAVFEGAREFIQELVEQRGPQVTNIVDGYTTQDAENGPAIVYHLAQHPEELRQIVALPPRQQIAALARLDERLGSASPAAPAAPARTPAAPVTRAPEPMKPVGGTPTAPTVSPDDEPYGAYKARRDREERDRAAAMAR